MKVFLNILLAISSYMGGAGIALMTSGLQFSTSLLFLIMGGLVLVVFVLIASPKN